MAKETKTETRRENRDMPLMSREAPVVSANIEARTADLVWSTGARVRRFDWWNDRYYEEELSMDPAHVRMGRLGSGNAPLLNSHNAYQLDALLGVVQSASLEGGEGRCTVKFSARDEVAPILQDVQDGIIRNVSVGYNIYKVERIAPAMDGDVWLYRVIDWEPMEVSLVTIPADAGAGVRSDDPHHPSQSKRTAPCEFITPPAAAGTTKEDRVMTEEEIRAAAAAETLRKQQDAEQRSAAAKAERDRIAGIREAVITLGGLEEPFAQRLIDDANTTPADAGMAVLRERAKRTAADPGRSAASVTLTSDENDVRRERLSNAIALRANPRAILARDDAGQRAAVEAAREFRGFTLIDMARECIEASGGSARRLSRREIASVALNLDHGTRAGMNSTSDFPIILGNTVNRTLRAGYDMAPRTFEPFTRRSTAPDFKQITRVQLSESTALQSVKEGGEYKAIQFGEASEKYSLGKFGGIVSLTWETLVNDDLGAFDRIPMSLAAEAAALESDIVYAILTGNPNMSDNVALFHASHGNLPTAAAITDITLGLGRALMRKQTGIKGRQLNLAPAYLIVGPDKEVEANKYTSAQFVAAKASDINPNFNTSLEVIVDARISGSKWYLAAAPAQVDTIEYAYLEGEEGLFTETRQGFDVDGLQIKVRHVFAAKAIDWRGLVYNSGA